METNTRYGSKNDMLRKLRFALDDSRNLPVAFEILAQFDEMQRTDCGYVSIDPETAQRRILRTIDFISAHLV